MTSNIGRELREDYPAVDVTTVVFSRNFAGIGCCVIPQDRLLTIADAIDAMVKALKDILDANYDFRNGMPEDWEGDPLQDACAAALPLVSSAMRREVL